MVAPEETGLIHDRNWDEEVIEFGTQMEYVCGRRQHFTASFEQLNVFATCNDFNQWIEPADWGVCIDCKQSLCAPY